MLVYQKCIRHMAEICRVVGWEWGPNFSRPRWLRSSSQSQVIKSVRKTRGQVPLPGRPEGCFAQRYLTPFFPNALRILITIERG